MGSTRAILSSVALAVGIVGQATQVRADAGQAAGRRVVDFTYVGGQCVDAAGKPGLNPKYVGDCGDLAGADLTGKDLTGKSLRGASLRGATLRTATLTGANLERADLGGARLDGATAGGTDFSYARMESAVWDGARISSSKFFGTKAAGASFRKTIQSGNGFESSDLTRASFDATECGNCRFPTALLYETSFTDVVFTGGSFKGADLSFATFARAKLNGTDLTKATGVQTSFAESTGEKPVLAEAVFRESDFSHSRLSNVDLSSAQLVESKLDGATWKSAKGLSTLIRGCSLAGAILDGSDLRLIRIEDSVLGTVSFLKADFRMARLQATGWETAKMKGAKINARTKHPFSAGEIERAGIILVGRAAEAGILMDPAFVDVGTDGSSEASSLFAFLSVDLTVKTEKYDPTQLVLDLDGVGTYLIPETENGNLPLAPEEVLAYQTFLAQGGNLILFYDTFYVMEKILGKDLTGMSNDSWKLDPEVASNLGLDITAERLMNLSATSSFATSSLPEGTRVIYADGGTATAFMIPQGIGRIWYIGWDFYDFPVRNAQMNAWGELLKAIMGVAMSGSR